MSNPNGNFVSGDTNKYWTAGCLGQGHGKICFVYPLVTLFSVLHTAPAFIPVWHLSDHRFITIIVKREMRRFRPGGSGG